MLYIESKVFNALGGLIGAILIHILGQYLGLVWSGANFGGRKKRAGNLEGSRDLRSHQSANASIMAAA